MNSPITFRGDEAGITGGLLRITLDGTIHALVIRTSAITSWNVEYLAGARKTPPGSTVNSWGITIRTTTGDTFLVYGDDIELADDIDQALHDHFTGRTVR